jgi:hypothetical protein
MFEPIVGTYRGGMEARQEFEWTAGEGIRVPARILEGDFSGWLRDAMATRRMSQRMLAALSGIDHTSVSRLLSGDRQPSLGTALALIRVLEQPRLRVTPPLTTMLLERERANGA